MYKRILLKLSGEALACPNGSGIDFDKVTVVAEQIKRLTADGVQVGIVIGGGNFWRGRQGRDMNRPTADYMGMLATAINSLGLQDTLLHMGVQAKLMTALNISAVGEPVNHEKAVEYLEQNKVVIFACGTGSPFFSTDTGAALRAAEIEADVILLAKNVDGIYDSDPKVNKNAKKYDKISYMDFIAQGLNAMDISAVTLCKENNIPILAFALAEENSIVRVANGEKMGTIIC